MVGIAAWFDVDVDGKISDTRVAAIGAGDTPLRLPRAESSLSGHSPSAELFAQAASCLVFALLGASTGLLLRRGTRMAALAVAVGYALAYWLIALRLGKELAISGDIPPALGGWSAVIVMGTVGVVLTRKAFSR